MNTCRKTRTSLRPLAGFVLLCMGTAAYIPAARAEDEPEKVRIARIEASLDQSAKRVLDACGAKVTVTIDWKSFPAEDVKKYAVDSFCSTPLEVLVGLCRGSNTKAYIKKSISKYTCHFGGEGKRSLSIDKKNGIQMTVDFKATNYDEWARKAMVETL
ncbi:MAG: hypothetical protein IPK13_14835 [Deltaproteobacteria bacterium]|nr:hypothetical protein [Deltaproteobacteria bacterium]